MVTIALVKSTGRRGIVLGTGFGAFQSEGDNGGLRAGQVAYVAIARESGELAWIPSEDIEIISVGGKPPGDWLGG